MIDLIPSLTIIVIGTLLSCYTISFIYTINELKAQVAELEKTRALANSVIRELNQTVAKLKGN